MERNARLRDLAWPSGAVIPGLQCGLGLIGLCYGESPALSGWPDSCRWLLCLAGLLALQWVHGSPALDGFVRKWGAATLALQAVLTFVPALVWHVSWPGTAGFLAGSVVTLLGRRWLGWAAFGTVAAGSWASEQSAVPRGPHPWITASVTVVIGLVVHVVMDGLRRSAQRRAELLALERRARQEEREEIARELHDRFASPLTAVTLKCETVARTLSREPECARRQLRDVVRLGRETLAELRATARGYRDLSVRDELEYARLLLTDAGVAVVLNNEAPPPDRDAAEVLAIAVREGVANLLRHSDATCCRIQLRQLHDGSTVLTMGNDGVRRDGAGDPREGAGLRNLSLRTASIGGRCRVAVSHTGWFTLTVMCPTLPGDRQRALCNLQKESGGCPEVAADVRV
ncbi:histidine kinase [Streptomyces sp. NPDC041068]|uniref:sensor histidine kinase n=1 Tax=Streptomyces sp. NPDC041068 TaxID=3155130 RepID=UPI0033E512B6